MSSYGSEIHCTVFASATEDTGKRSGHRCTVHGRYNLEVHTNFYTQSDTRITRRRRALGRPLHDARAANRTRGPSPSLAWRGGLPRRLGGPWASELSDRRTP